MTVPDLLDRVALVTGGDRGIGRSISLALARAGAHVAIAYRARGDEAAAVVRELTGLGGRHTAVQGDVSVEGDVRRMAESAASALGDIDVLVCNAGVAPVADLEAVDAATFDQTIAVNLRSAFLATQAVLPGMRRRRFGRLLYLSSTAAHVGGIIGPHYAASKAGLLGLMHAYAAALAAEGITANALAPAIIQTEMIAGNPRADPKRMPMGRFGTPEEVADMAVAVLGNGYVTGQTVQVNGGAYLT